VYDYGLPYSAVQGEKIFGSVPTADLEKYCYIPVYRLESSGRMGLIGEVSFPELSRKTFLKSWKVVVRGDILMVRVPDEVLQRASRSRLQIQESSQDALVGPFSSSNVFTNRDIIRTLVYDQKTYRHAFLCWSETTSVIQEVGLIVQENGGRYVLSTILFYDLTALREDVRKSFQGYVQDRVLDVYIYHPHCPLQIGLSVMRGGVPVDGLIMLPERLFRKYNEAVKWTPHLRYQCQRFPDFRHWSGSSAPNESRILIVDAEHDIRTEPPGTVLTPTLMAAAAVRDHVLVEYKSFMAPCPGVLGTKGEVANRYSSYPLMSNGGLEGFRAYVYEKVRQGYKVYSKGPPIEAQLLSDYGVRFPVATRGKQALDFTTVRGLVDSCVVKRKFQGLESIKLGDPITVHDLGCSSYDVLSRYYFDQWTPEICWDAYELTGYNSVDHNPLLEVVTFACHLLANRSLKLEGTVNVDPPIYPMNSGVDPSRTTRLISHSRLEIEKVESEFHKQLLRSKGEEEMFQDLPELLDTLPD